MQITSSAFVNDAMLTLSEGATREEVDAAMQGHVLATAELMGWFASGGLVQ